MPQNRISSSKPVVFAVLLPLISRGKQDILGHLRCFANSLVRTSQSYFQKNGRIRFRLVVYLGLYHTDDCLLGPATADPLLKAAEHVLLQEKVPEIIAVVRDQHLASSSQIWNDCANKAFSDGCDFMALMTSDAELRDEGWIETVYATFDKLAASSGAPFGFGCVALQGANGLPAFPVVHRTHMEIFKEQIMPDMFIDESAEFLFQLYRRFGCSSIISCQVSDVVRDRSSHDISVKDWTFEKLDDATATAETYLQDKGSKCERILTLDVVVPSFRVTIPYLRAIIDLEASKTCSILYSIIIDNPDSPYISELQVLYSNRPDVRIIVNKVNLGTSATRNRGINESAAEWIHFLDDDIVPDEDLFLNVEKYLRANPNACGCVCVTDFPPADAIWQAALYITGMPSAFNIAKRMSHDVPWSATANLVTRRNIKDGVEFKPIYPKSGGGEDIDYCLWKRAASKARGDGGFVSAPDVRVVHPWWPGGRRGYWRFYVWAYGDEHLSRRFPEYTYLDHVPNSAECFIFCLLVGMIAAFTGRWKFAGMALKAASCVFLTNIFHDCFRHLVLHPERLQNVDTSVRGIRWVAAIAESSFIRFFREIARLQSMVIEHGRFNFLRRFDFDAGRLGTTVIEEERKFRMQKVALSALCILALVCC